MVSAQFQLHIACKIKQVSSEKFNCTLCDPWIEPLLGHKLINLEDFRSKQGFFLGLFREKKPKAKFVFSPIVEVVGYFSFKKYTTWKKCRGRKRSL
jgi:hypothetical protein